MTGAVRLEILSSLASIRDDVERQVAKLDRYRALKAIEQTIVDFPGLEDVNRALGELRDSMQRTLSETREVRALQKIEKIMPDLSDVLAFLSEPSEKAADAPVRTGRSVGANSDATANDPTSKVNLAPSSDETDVVVSAGEFIEQTDQPQARPAWRQEFAHQPAAQIGIAEKADPDDPLSHANDAGLSADDASAAPAPVSYGIAQFLNPEEPDERPVIAERRHDDDPASPFVAPSSREGRAA